MLDEREFHVLYLRTQPHLLILVSPFLIPDRALRALPYAHLHCTHIHREHESYLILVLVNDIRQDVILLQDIHFPLQVFLSSNDYLCEVLHIQLCQELEMHYLPTSLL